MSARRASWRARWLAPFIAEDGRGGISFSAFFAAVIAILIGALITWLLSSIRSAGDLGGLITEAARRYLGFPLLNQAIQWLKSFMPSNVAAALFLQIVLLLGPLLVTVVSWLVWGAARRLWRSSAQDPPEPGSIVMPRERGGGARLGGWMFALMAALISLAIVLVPRLLDWLLEADWLYFSRGFVAAGLTAAASFIAFDSAAYWLLQPNVARTPPGKLHTTPDVDGMVAKLREAFDKGQAPSELISIAVSSAPGTDESEAVGPDPASTAHLKCLGKRSPAERKAWLRAVRTFHEEPDNIAVLEPLGDIHFAFFVEIISAVQDRGQSVIVVVPDVSAARVAAELKQAFSQHCGILTQSKWTDIDDGEARNKSSSSLENLLIVTDEKLTEVLSGPNNASFGPELERAGLLLLFDAHLFDLSQLRVDIAILLRKTPHSRLRVVVHAAFWRGMKAAMDEMVSATGRPMSRIEFDAAGDQPMRALVFRNDQQARDALLAAFFPNFDRPRSFRMAHRQGLEPLPLVAHSALRGDYSIRSGHLHLIDPEAADFSDRWQSAAFRTVGAGSPAGSDEARLSAMDRLEDVHDGKRIQPDPDSTAPLLLAQDRSNLIGLLATLKAARGHIARTAIIACEPYPMRDFLVDLAREGAFDDGRYLPIAPRPQGGLRELARLVFSRLVPATSEKVRPSATAGLPRGEAEVLFRDFRRRTNRTAGGHSPTRRGLKGLLDSQFATSQGGFMVEERRARLLSPPPMLGAASPIDDEAVYICTNAQDRAAAMSPFIGLFKAGGAGNLVRIGWVPRDDFGLAYAAGTVLGIPMTQEKFQIASIDDEGVTLRRLADASADGNARSIERMVFCRAYALHLDDPDARALDVDVRHDTADLRLGWIQLVLPMQRLTYNTIREHVLAGESPPGPMDLAEGDQSRRPPSPCVANVLRLLAPAADSALSAKTAFMLQVALSDLIFTLFPWMAHRIAVISPQAAGAFAELLSCPNDLEQNVAARYPRFAALVDGAVGTDPEDGQRMTDMLDPLILKCWGAGRHPPIAGQDQQVIDIYVIEDWPSDLGVCEALRDRELGVLPILREYLGWLEANKDRTDLYHRFGSKKLLDVFAYADAAALLRTI